MKIEDCVNHFGAPLDFMVETALCAVSSECSRIAWACGQPQNRDRKGAARPYELLAECYDR
ncbi:MAG TPA: hypothetical protein VGQ81_09305, partial [Acidobacteriota bacterium]|nr:hypothetical protein [Acidobacteriota bacterium]